MLLILDLDDTLFPTRSIPRTVVAPALTPITAYCSRSGGPSFAEKVMDQLWQKPFDEVARTFAIPEAVQTDFYHRLQALEFSLDITPFSDYAFLRALPYPKVLVTTGFRPLQQAKIKALQIRQDVEAIWIDDPLDPVRKYKQGIFSEILQKRRLRANQCWVIGDNPASEIQAGRKLGMHTIQRVPADFQGLVAADFTISSFSALSKILTSSS